MRFGRRQFSPKFHISHFLKYYTLPLFSPIFALFRQFAIHFGIYQSVSRPFNYDNTPVQTVCTYNVCVPSIYTVHCYYSRCNCLWKRFRKLEECCQVVSTPLKLTSLPAAVLPSSSFPHSHHSHLPCTPPLQQVSSTSLLCYVEAFIF